MDVIFPCKTKPDWLLFVSAADIEFKDYVTASSFFFNGISGATSIVCRTPSMLIASGPSRISGAMVLINYFFFVLSKIQKAAKIKCIKT